MRVPDNFFNIERNRLTSIFGIDAKIKVTPEVLREKSHILNVKIQRIRQAFNLLERDVNGTNSYWKGEANDVYREAYTEFRDEVDEIIRRLSEHVRDLNEMAGNYQQAEDDIKNMIEDLPNNIIS